MEDFIIIANQTLTSEEQVIYSNSNGAVVKTILLSAPTQTEQNCAYRNLGVFCEWQAHQGSKSL